MSYCVYKHTFPNGKVYIGITSLNPEKRWKNGKGYTKKNKNGEYRQQLMARAVLKYGWDNIEHEILFNNLTKECAEQKEIDLISYYQSNKQDFGYNISNGGNTTGTVSESTKQKLRDINLGKKHSKETRNKISIIGKGRCVSQQTKKKISKSLMGHYVSTETRKKLSEANKGEKNPNYGKHLSTETRKKLSESHKGEKNPNYGKHLSDEHKRNLSQSLKGRVLSEEHRRKIGEASKKRMQSKNERYKLAKSRMKPVLCIETNIIYQSITEANKLIGTSTSILRCLRGEYKTSSGYHWKYLYDQTKRDGTIIQGAISLGLITEEEALRQLKGQSKKEKFDMANWYNTYFKTEDREIANLIEEGQTIDFDYDEESGDGNCRLQYGFNALDLETIENVAKNNHSSFQINSIDILTNTRHIWEYKDGEEKNLNIEVINYE